MVVRSAEFPGEIIQRVVEFSVGQARPFAHRRLVGDAAYSQPGGAPGHHGGDGAWFYLEPERAAQFFLKHGETTILPTLYFNLDRETMLNFS